MKIEIEVGEKLLADLEAILRSPYWPSMGEPEAGETMGWRPLTYSIDGALIFPNLMPKEEVLLDDVKTVGDVATQIIRHYLCLYRNARIALITDAIHHYGGDDDAVDTVIEDYDAWADTRGFNEILADVKKAVLG